MKSPPESRPAASGEAPAFPRDRIPSIRRVMMPRDTNAFGTIFGGVILAEIDLAAAVEAHRHHGGRLVTVAMDGVVFRAPVHVGDCVSFFTETVRIGTTSIRVKIRVWAEGRFSRDTEVFVTEAEATMVAVDDRGDKVRIEAERGK
jgi:acyl-CoA thioesterase YciA